VDEVKLGLARRNEDADSKMWLRGDHGTGMKFVSVRKEIRAVREEDMIEEKEEEVDDGAETTDTEGEERETSQF